MSRLRNNVCLQTYLKLQDHIDSVSFQSIVAQCNNHVVMQHNISGLTLRGQFELLGENILLLDLLGLPRWLNS
jgi:hypothetical protein